MWRVIMLYSVAVRGRIADTHAGKVCYCCCCYKAATVVVEYLLHSSSMISKKKQALTPQFGAMHFPMQAVAAVMLQRHSCTLHESLLVMVYASCLFQAAVVSLRPSLQVLVPMIAYVAAPASGAHFNPIVTFAFMATGILVRQLLHLEVAS